MLPNDGEPVSRLAAHRPSGRAVGRGPDRGARRGRHPHVGARPPARRRVPGPRHRAAAHRRDRRCPGAGAGLRPHDGAAGAPGAADRSESSPSSAAVTALFGGTNRAGAVTRVVVGSILVIVGASVFLVANTTASAARQAMSAIVVFGVGIGLVFGPWLWRLANELAEERRERIRVAGAGRGRGPPPRLGAADARAGAAQRRRPAPGGQPRAAGRSASCARGCSGPAVGRRRARSARALDALVGRGRGPTTGCRSRSSRSATARSTSGSTRCSPRRARRWSTPRSTPAPVRSRLRGGRRVAALVFVRDRGVGFDPDAVAAEPARRRRLDRGPHGAPRRRAVDRAARRRRHRGRARAARRPGRDGMSADRRARLPRRRPPALPCRGPRRARRRRSIVVGERVGGRRGGRADPASARPTSCSSTCTCRRAAARAVIRQVLDDASRRPVPRAVRLRRARRRDRRRSAPAPAATSRSRSPGATWPTRSAGSRRRRGVLAAARRLRARRVRDRSRGAASTRSSTS